MSWFSPKAKALPALAEGKAVWAVGDIHGRSDLLVALLGQILDMQEGSEPVRIIFLGDYVDRGQQSREVLDTMVAVGIDPRFEATFIRGNHDHMMLSFHQDARAGRTWLGMGAGATLRSYGVEGVRSEGSDEAWFGWWRQFTDAMPEAHVSFLGSLASAISIDDYFFTHAGVRPGRALDRQRPEDLMWIRNRFLEDRHRFDRIIVHGHTPTSAPHSDDRRIGLDTGAYYSGALTAVCLSGTERRFLQVQGRATDTDFPDPRTTVTTIWDVPTIVAV